MSALLKYEFRKTWLAKAVILGITAVAEIVFLIGLALGPGNSTGETMTGTGAVVLTMLAGFGIFAIGIQSILTLHRDMNTKQGYMLYMTPRNSYQILGAKTLENGLSILLAAAFFFLLGMLDITLVFSRYGELEQLWEFFREFMRQVSREIPLNTYSIFCVALAFVCSWLATVSMAYLADILSAALLNGKKLNGLITFGIFILLSVLLGWLQNALQPAGVTVETGFLVRALIGVLYSACMYFASSWIMERYLSV